MIHPLDVINLFLFILIVVLGRYYYKKEVRHARGH